MTSHPTTCPAYCPYPDTGWVAPGAILPKCRGGDCTLCDELDCTCPVSCTSCGGKGLVPSAPYGEPDSCGACHGRGEIPRSVIEQDLPEPEWEPDLD